MVRGLDLFKAHFQEYKDRYVLIGGTACSVAMEKAGLEFRATKDLDIVLCVEALDSEFVKVFWKFIRAGGYRNQEKSTGKKLFYRFHAPDNNAFPVMLELFSRKPDALTIHGAGHLTPIPVDEDASSLSAILLNDEYYQFIHAGKQELDGLSVVGTAYLIPLKARAWLDMTERRRQGERVDEKDIKKHKNDVFRLYQILEPDASIPLTVSIENDLRQFLDNMAEETVDLRALGLKKVSLRDVLEDMKRIYGLKHGN